MMDETSYLPTPEQIVAECLAIQAEWSDKEREKRIRSDWRPVPVEATPVSRAEC
jgi:hypothetical protein